MTSNQPDISVIIPIGGRERSSHLELVVAGLRAQSDVRFEIIVVEESRESELCEHLPKDVIYKHIYSPLVEQKGFNKGWALNVGARLARAPLLLMLDADFLVPTGFLKECIRLSNGSVSVRPGRYIYYLDEISSLRLLSNGCLADDLSVNLVVQNNPTPYLIPSSMYWDIGGHDEAFFGWGGEDLEFLTRLRKKSVLEGGTLPVIHLWHPAAPKKASGDRNVKLTAAINQADVVERIRLLKMEKLGSEQPKVVTVSELP